jgi:hypothetical protein
MEEERKYGRMVRSIKVSGEMDKQTEKVFSIMSMVMFTRASSKMTKLMAMEYTIIRMGLSTMVCG